MDDVNYIKQKYPDKVPILVYAKDNVSQTKRYIIQSSLTIGEFVNILKKRTQLKPTEAIYLFTKTNIALSFNYTLDHVYAKYSDSDGFLRIVYAKENTFG